MSQYNDGYSSFGEGEYAELSGYYEANPVPKNSEMVPTISLDQIPYLNMARKFNKRVPTMIPSNYDVLSNQQFTAVNNMDRVLSKWGNGIRENYRDIPSKTSKKADCGSSSCKIGGDRSNGKKVMKRIV